jgi:hypothetical protein
MKNSKNAAPSIFEFGRIGQDSLGYLTVAQHKKNIPFPIKRLYWVYDTPENIVRGHHAHKELEQVLVCVSGTINVHIENIEREKKEFRLSDPSFGLYVPKMHWRTLQFSAGAVLLSIASMEYEPSDYIHSYEEFLETTKLEL